MPTPDAATRPEPSAPSRPGGVVTFPRWLRELDGQTLRADAVAGATTAVLLVPQAMAYAALAGLPPTAGLYAASVPVLVYALLGSSRHVSIGPAAIDSMMVGAALAAAVASDLDPLPRAALLALLVGTLQLLGGVLRLGSLVGLLSRPVVSAFLTGAALTIAGTQLGPLLGVRVPSGGPGHALVANVLGALGGASLPTVAVGIGSLAVLVTQRRLAPRAPGGLVVVVAASLASWALDLDALGVARVGSLPSLLPTVAVPQVPWDEVAALAVAAVPLALISYLEAISSAQAFSTRYRYAISPSRELAALGAANLAAGVTGGFPIAGGLSRSAVHAAAGARTQGAAGFTGLLVLLALAAAGPLLAWIPKATLAAVVLAAVGSLVDLRTPRDLMRLKQPDGIAWIATFVATLELGPTWGVGIGVAASLGAFLWRSMQPHVAVEGRVPGGAEYRNVLRRPEVVLPHGVAVLRVDASLYFANAARVRQAIEAVHAQEGPPLRAIVLDASAINDIDTSALETLRELRRDLAASGTQLVFARVKGPVRDVLARSTLGREVGPETLFETVHDAVTRYGDGPEECVADRVMPAPVPGTLPPPSSGGGA